MSKIRILIFLAVTFAPALLTLSCKDKAAEEAARLQAQQDSIMRAEAAQREADSIKALEAEAAARAAEAAAAAAAEAEAARNQSLKFHVIVGGFVIQSNADNYLAQMKSQYSAARLFVAPNGYKLVSIGDFATYEEAVRMMRGVGREDLWVFEEGGRYDTSSWLENKDDFEGGQGGDDYYNVRGNSRSGAPVDEFDM